MTFAMTTRNNVRNFAEPKLAKVTEEVENNPQAADKEVPNA